MSYLEVRFVVGRIRGVQSKEVCNAAGGKYPDPFVLVVDNRCINELLFNRRERVGVDCILLHAL